MFPSSIDVPMAPEPNSSSVEECALKWLGQSMQQFSKEKTLMFLSEVAVKGCKDVEANNITRTVVDKEIFRSHVSKYLEHFVCGEPPENGMDKLKQLNRPASFCGRQFDVGDPTFTCRDCATDQTCVFCSECFRKSAHIDHRYKLHASLGSGGCCDCGDVEAWKQDPACEIHSQDHPDAEGDFDPLHSFPADIQHRAKALFSCLLSYCIDMICWKHKSSDATSNFHGRNLLDATHHAVLFNDEVHTYDDVVVSLTKSIGCDQQKALLLASIVDKEGRSIIYSGAYTRCDKICNDVKGHSSRFGKKPLVCEVIHQDILAHQQLALEIMEWIYRMMSFSDGLRRIVCQVVIEPSRDSGASILEHVLLADSLLWKVARSVFHQALMSGLMLDQFGKKEFSVTFAKKYKEMMRLFVKDDHEHSVSATSLSVQIFTAPTTARMLMIEQSLLKNVIECFVEHLQPAVSGDGYINLQHTQPPNSKPLKRIYYILHDLRFLLNQCPTQWTDPLRHAFLEAMDVYLILLKAMQNMDPVKRRLRTHIEFEPHWQDGYFLQLWLMPTLEAVLSWCGSDKQVLEETARKAMAILRRIGRSTVQHSHLASGGPMIQFDISTEHVSVHMALSRFIAGLIPMSLRHGISIADLLNLDGTVEDKLLLLEYPLRSLVLSAQVSAGMWIRNGFSLLNQVAYYQNVRCSSEMYDRDVILLQTVATLLNPDHLLEILVYRYGLSDWISPSFDEKKLNEDDQRFLSTVTKEFFLILVSILSERYVVGIGAVSSGDILKREVIHRLALGPCSRSELVKNLPCKEPDDVENCSFESQLDGVLAQVSHFRKPGVTGTGLYELKEDCYNHCAQFFYHYSRNEQSKILEVWRQKSKKKDNKEVVVVPPIPPCFSSSFSPVTRLMTSSRLGYLFAVVLEKALQPKCDTMSDTVIEEVLYLICYGVYEEQRTSAQIERESFANLIYKTKYDLKGAPVSIVDLLHELQQHQPEREYSALLAWTLSFVTESLGPSQDPSSSRMASSPKRKQSSTSDDAGIEKQRRIRLAKEKREKVMAQMSAMQKAFIETNSHFLNLQEQTSSPSMEVDAGLAPEDLTSVPIAVGRNKTSQSLTPKMITCIVCQEEQEITTEGPPVVLTALVQRSTVLSDTPQADARNSISGYNPLFLPDNMFIGVYSNSCGHVMHGECWQKYFDGRRMLNVVNRRSIGINKNEYLCPLCSSLCNTVLPMLPKVSQQADQGQSGCEQESLQQPLLPESLGDFIAFVDRITRNESTSDDHMASDQRAPMPRSFAHGVTMSIRLIMRRLVELRDDTAVTTESLLRLFSHAVYSVVLGSPPEETAPRLLTLSWSTCSFTIQAIESYLANDCKPLFGGLTSRQSECLDSLVAYAHGSGAGLAPKQAEKNAVKLWSALSANGASLFSAPSLLDLNLFGTMVNLRFSLPFLLAPWHCDETPSFYSALDHSIVRLFDALIVVQTLLQSSDSEEIDEEGCTLNTEEQDPSVMPDLGELWVKCQSLARNIASVTSHGNLRNLLTRVIRRRQTFLRCAALFFRFLTNVDAPLVLRDYVNPLSAQVERQVLCSYLDLPLSPVVLLKDVISPEKNTESPLRRLIESLCSSPMTMATISSERASRPQPKRKVPIDLPHDYSQCITQASGFRCPTSGDASRSPALCLVCGEMLCSQGFCCQTEVDGTQVGACTAHSLQCGGGVGMFLQVRDCEILLLYNKVKGCFLPPPYLDEYGEADHGFRRGNPLFLSTERYQSLINMWRLHNIPETIARQQEKSKSLLAYHWSDF